MKSSNLPLFFLLAASILLLSNYTCAQPGPKEVKVVQKMFDAFTTGDMATFMSTLSDEVVWTYHGTDDIPYSGEFSGKEGVQNFVGQVVSNVEIINFQVDELVSKKGLVIALGSETQKIIANGKILNQTWVQVYEVKDDLIVKMDEYANTAYAAKLFMAINEP